MDEKAIQDILTSLEGFEYDLFSPENPVFGSIQSGIKATPIVAIGLSVALKISDRFPKNKRLTFDNTKAAKSGDKSISQVQKEEAGLTSVIGLAECSGPLILENRV